MRVYVGIPHCRYSRCPYLPNITTRKKRRGRLFSGMQRYASNLTQQEVQLLDQVATAKGVARSEWMRDVILRELRGDSATDPSLAEILGVRLLLVNVLRPLAAGQRLTPEAFDKLLDEISEAKYALAGKLAASAGRK